MTINEIIHKALMAGVGVPEKISELVDELVKKGELSERQGAKLVKEYSAKASKSGEDISKSVSEIINKALEKMNIPTRDEVEKLSRKITALSARIKKLEESAPDRE
ncbi:MAG: phasin family protein [Nitrospirota bacterium]